jgi:NitT/TauT family transport system permease protein
MIAEETTGGLARLSKVLAYVYPLAALVVLVLVWEFGTMAGEVPRYVLPSASETLQEMIAEWPLLLENSLSTAVAILIGFLLSIVIGIGVGLLIVWIRPVEQTVWPLLVGSQAIPKIALAPIFVVWFGFGLTPRIVMAFLISFFPMVVATVAGMRAIQPELVFVSRCMGLSPAQSFIKVRFPNALPHIFDGLKVAIALAAVGAVVGEFVGSDSGLGNVMLRALGLTNTPLLYAGIIVLTGLAILMFLVVEVLERLAIPWHVSQRRP